MQASENMKLGLRIGTMICARLADKKKDSRQSLPHGTCWPSTVSMLRPFSHVRSLIKNVEDTDW